MGGIDRDYSHLNGFNELSEKIEMEMLKIRVLSQNFVVLVNFSRFLSVLGRIFMNFFNFLTKNRLKSHFQTIPRLAQDIFHSEIKNRRDYSSSIDK